MYVPVHVLCFSSNELLYCLNVRSCLLLTRNLQIHLMIQMQCVVGLLWCSTVFYGRECEVIFPTAISTSHLTVPVRNACGHS